MPLLDEDNKRRIQIAKSYFEKIRHDHVVLPKAAFLSHNAMHVFPVFVNDRAHFQNYLAEKGIGTNVHYPVPAHQQKAFKELNDLSFPQTEYLHRTEVSLPCHPLLTEKEVLFIVDCINNY